MKATGVVRKIDELGRIVIPKEIRKTLGIKDEEQLEIYLENECIVLKKFSNFNRLDDFTNIIIDVVSNVFNKNILITDREKVIGVSAKYKNDYLGKNISDYLEKIMVERKRIVENNFKEIEFVKNIYENMSCVIYPIIINSDVIGIVSLFSDKIKCEKIDEQIADLIVKIFCKIVDE